MTAPCGGRLYHLGHTCGDCQSIYFARHPHGCTYGQPDPRIVHPEPQETPDEKAA